MTAWRTRVSPWVPPAVRAWAARRHTDGNTFVEFDGSWEQALASVGGYGDTAILERVVEATRSVERGEAAFERDSVLFAQPEYSWALLSALLAAAVRDGRLHVLDFGGALGSIYRQHRQFLDGVADLRWAVVEQSGFVRAGREEFTTDRLSFHDRIDAATEAVDPNVVLLGSSLQYLPSPQSTLDDLARTSARTLVLDRTPIAEAEADVLTIQTVPSSIYPASYPMWVLSRARISLWAESAWRLQAAYSSDFPRIRTSGGLKFGWDGLILER